MYHNCSVTKLCLTLCNLIDCSTTGSTVLLSPISRSLLRFMSTELVMLSNHLIFCRPLLLLTSIFPSIRVLSDKLSLHIRWPVPLFCNISKICCFIFNFLSKRVLNFLKSYKNNTQISCTSFGQICSWLMFCHIFHHYLSQ